MLQERNFNKLLLLAALLVGAAGTLSASGFFTINAGGDRVQFSSENLVVDSRQYFRWSELGTVVPSGQRVLTQQEWEYMFSSRTNAYHLYAQATVKGEQGLVILPDDDTWVLPDGVSFNYVETEGGYSKNIYDASQWTLMEAAGAVFLPCRGYSTDGTTGEYVTTHGTYWTTTEYDTNDPYYIQFDDTYFYAEKHNSSAGDVYRSVRTVTTAPAILSEEDEQSVFETKKSSLSGGSDAYIIRTLRKAGCFNTLCLPFSVPDITASPLGDAAVYEFAGATVEDGTLRLDISAVTGNCLTAGKPYLIEWDNTGETLSLMHFTGITWDVDNDADDAGTGDVVYHGFYGKKHINDNTNGSGEHLNLFLYANNELYWPSDGGDEDAKMLGFRAYFQITAGSGAMSPIRRGMPAVLHIVQNNNTTTDVDNVQRDDVPCTKVLRDGQLYLMFKGRMYNVQGQLVEGKEQDL